MKSVQDTYLLHNGVAIPCVGYTAPATLTERSRSAA